MENRFQGFTVPLAFLLFGLVVNWKVERQHVVVEGYRETRHHLDVHHRQRASTVAITLANIKELCRNHSCCNIKDEEHCRNHFANSKTHCFVPFWRESLTR